LGFFLGIRLCAPFSSPIVYIATLLSVIELKIIYQCVKFFSKSFAPIISSYQMRSDLHYLGYLWQIRPGINSQNYPSLSVSCPDIGIHRECLRNTTVSYAFLHLRNMFRSDVKRVSSASLTKFPITWNKMYRSQKNRKRNRYYIKIKEPPKQTDWVRFKIPRYK